VWSILSPNFSEAEDRLEAVNLLFCSLVFLKVEVEVSWSVDTCCLNIQICNAQILVASCFDLSSLASVLMKLVAKTRVKEI
jgi:hypothetical protein